MIINQTCPYRAVSLLVCIMYKCEIFHQFEPMKIQVGYPASTLLNVCGVVRVQAFTKTSLLNFMPLHIGMGSHVVYYSV